LKPKLTLVGAGPGDPDLISIKGVKALKQANVILYDALIDPILLNYAKKDCQKVYVGKRAGIHSLSQKEINQLIVDYALKFGHVVRLKGGDPFVFGRGFEELLFATTNGLEIAVIPGITSAIAVPAIQGIPITSRGINESFWVLTGHTLNGKLTEDLKLAAQSSATIVILMGMTNLSSFVNIFRTLGKEKLPIAVIQNGTLENENAVIGIIDNIELLVQQKQIKNPAIIVVGKAVELRKELNNFF
jgi:uroporphyrin-III C-methyltransferase